MQTVTYVYTHNSIPRGNVTAKYVDTKGKTIAHDVVKTGNIEIPTQQRRKQSRTIPLKRYKVMYPVTSQVNLKP